MFHATLKMIMAHKLRLVLTALSIVLGVAFVAGTFVLTDSMKDTLNGASAEATSGVDVAIRSESAFENEANNNVSLVRNPFPASVQSAVAAVDGVADAQGEVGGGAVVVAPDGDAISVGGSSWNPNPKISPLSIKEGRAPTGPGDVVLDAATVSNEGFHLRDTIRIATVTGSRNYRLVGTAQFAGEDDQAGFGFVAMSLPAAQEAFDRVGRYDSIAVQAGGGVSDAGLKARIARVLPADVEALTGEQLLAEITDDTNSGLQFVSIFLLTFAFVALLVGAFIIYNTFSIIITQRTKELALMRALGASPKQVRRSVVIESLVVGVIGSVIGLALGFLVAIGLRALMGTFGVPLPEGSMVLKPRTIVAAFALGIIVTVFSSVGPARRAAKVAPLAAMRDVSTDRRASGRRRTIIGAVLSVVGVFAVVNGLSGGTIAFVGIGAVAIFVGVAMLAPALARPAAAIIGGPMRRFGTEWNLARQNSMRSARRTASTASALMIGLALVTATLILAASAISSTEGQVDRQAVAQYIVKAENYETFSPTFVDQLRDRPEIAAAYGMTTAPAKIDGSTKDVTAIDVAAIDPTNPSQALNLGKVQGDIASLDDGGLAVWDEEAENKGWRVGHTVAVEFPDGTRPQQVEVIYQEHGATGNYLIADTTYREHYIDQGDLYALIVPANGASAGAAAAAQRLVDRDFPNLEVLTKSEFIADQKAELDLFVGLITVLLGLSILIALLGVANTLALSIFERTHEIGLLRAVGMTRTQLRRMVRGEAAIIAVFGAMLGLAVGVFFGVAMVKALSGQGIDNLSIPPGKLAVVVVATLALGVLAGTLPARKAARAPVLAAITSQ